jgi:isocitrate dehydrogenase kinase/phosphatase
MTQAANIARTILEGFDRHYSLFRNISARARQRFERSDWAAVREANKARIHFYDVRVTEAVEAIRQRFADADDQRLWPQIKLSYITLLYEHHQPECAETFYNSVACRVLHQRYYRNEYIFARPAISTEHLVGRDPIYRCYYPDAGSLTPVLRKIFGDIGLSRPFEDLERDLSFVERAIQELFPGEWTREPNFQVQVLSSLFFRNKAAYLVGRAVNGHVDTPFVIPILQNGRGAVYLDTLCVKPEHVGRIFSLAHANFMADMEVPSAYVSFLRSLMKSKRKAELYTLVGLQKQGKTLFYRDLLHHLQHSTDSFQIAPGVRGMVMVVFTLPSFPFVFKIIRDWFAPPKDTDAATVRERYLFVKDNDRVGRMADTLEYSSVAFPRARFSPELLDELRRLAPSMIAEEGDRLIVKHLWVERRMVPLDIYLREASDENVELAIRDYGDAIKELASANVFPGDLLLKNFGVTRFGRVVFYDYDELTYLTDCNFRRLPTARFDEDETRESDWFSVGPRDIFPEQFPTFLMPAGKPRELFLKFHGDLADPGWWIAAQERCRRGEQQDVFPYPQDIRFSHRFAGGAQEKSS